MNDQEVRDYLVFSGTKGTFKKERVEISDKSFDLTDKEAKVYLACRGKFKDANYAFVKGSLLKEASKTLEQNKYYFIKTGSGEVASKPTATPDKIKKPRAKKESAVVTPNKKATVADLKVMHVCEKVKIKHEIVKGRPTPFNNTNFLIMMDNVEKKVKQKFDSKSIEFSVRDRVIKFENEVMPDLEALEEFIGSASGTVEFKINKLGTHRWQVYFK